MGDNVGLVDGENVGLVCVCCMCEMEEEVEEVLDKHEKTAMNISCVQSHTHRRLIRRFQCNRCK